MLHEDWLMRQIDAMVVLVARLVFHKNGPEYVPGIYLEATHCDQLHQRLIALLDEGRLGDAENMLFAELRPDDLHGLEVATDFYARLNALDDAALQAGDFTREELEEGFQDLLRRYRIVLPQ